MSLGSFFNLQAGQLQGLQDWGVQPNSLLTGLLDAWSSAWSVGLSCLSCLVLIFHSMCHGNWSKSISLYQAAQHFILSEDKFTSEPYSADYSNLVARFFMPEKACLIKGLFLSQFCLHSPQTSPLVILYSSTSIFIFSYCFIWQINILKCFLFFNHLSLLSQKYPNLLFFSRVQVNIQFFL